MKKFIIRTLLSALGLFEKVIVNKFPSEWVKQSSKLVLSRLRLFAEALTDGNPDDKGQLEEIAKSTLAAPEFLEFQNFITSELSTKLPDEKLVQILLLTEKLRVDLFTSLGDNDPKNKEQLKQVFANFIHTEDFDTIAILMATLLADKYAKNETIKAFLIEIVTELVNSDDDQN